MIHVDVSDAMSEEEVMPILMAKMEQLFEQHASKVMLSWIPSHLVGTTMEESREKLSAIFAAFCEEVQRDMNGAKCQIGVGSAYEAVDALGDSYGEAVKSLRFAMPVQWYEELGFWRLVMGSENQKPMQEYMQQVLGSILQYDEEGHGELLKTLMTYFDCNECMKDVATAMFIHPNTVKYRMVQIQELTGLQLSISHEKMQLYNAVQIWKMI